MQTSLNISAPQFFSFGNTEKGGFRHLQSVDYQYLCCSQNNTVSTGKELDPETGYSYFGARYLESITLNLWLSVDPTADKYPSISPYAYCAWNPLKLVDPDGREIVIGESSVHYSPGMSIKGLDRFTRKVVQALDRIYKTEIGKELIDDLNNSTNIFSIRKGLKDEFVEDDFRKAYKNQYINDPVQNEHYVVADNKSIFEGGSGGTISWNPAGSILPTTDGGRRNAIIDLAHELFHAKDANNGLLDSREILGIEKKEWQAVYYENILREQMGAPLRTHYEKEVNEKGRFLRGSGTPILQDGKQIIPFWL